MTKNSHSSSNREDGPICTSAHAQAYRPTQAHLALRAALLAGADSAPTGAADKGYFQALRAQLPKSQ